MSTRVYLHVNNTLLKYFFSKKVPYLLTTTKVFFFQKSSIYADHYQLPNLFVVCSTGNEELLSTLARLHDTLLPSLQQGFRLIFTAGADGTQNSFGSTHSDIALAFKMLSVRLVKFGWKLLDYCYLSSDLFEGNLPLLMATKMFPAKVEDPVIRGDILVQTFREICSGLPSAHLGNQSGETFLQNVEKNYNILSRVDSLRSIGKSFMVWILGFYTSYRVEWKSGTHKADLNIDKASMMMTAVPIILTNPAGFTCQVNLHA